MLLPDMPTGRHASAAVHLPWLGDLIVGGQNKSGDNLKTAEILKSVTVDSETTYYWEKISSMLKPRWLPSDVYFEGFAYVVEPVLQP